MRIFCTKTAASLELTAVVQSGMLGALRALLVRVEHLLLLFVSESSPLGHRAGCALGGRWGRLAGAVAIARCG